MLSPHIHIHIRYLHANALAWRAHRTSFDFEFHGVVSTVQTVPFRVWCRLRLQQRFQVCMSASTSVGIYR